MKLQQLNVFVAVVEEGGIRAAARRMNLAQAAVTKAMRTLEEEVGQQLLLRKARGVGLTQAGERLLPRARAWPTDCPPACNWWPPGSAKTVCWPRAK
jgi:DNA-binding transcriptional LysR family regulator